MTSYLVLEAPGGPDRDHRTTRFIADRFSWLALLFPWLWFAIHRMWWIAVSVVILQVALHVDWLTQDVHDTAEGSFTNRNLDRFFQVSNFQTALQAVRSTHGDGTNHATTQLLLNFQHQTSITILNLESAIYLRYCVLREFDVNYGADNLDNLSSCHLESST